MQCIVVWSRDCEHSCLWLTTCHWHTDSSIHEPQRPREVSYFILPREYSITVRAPQTFGLFLLCLVFLSIPFVVQRIPSVISQTSNRSLKELVFFVWKLNFGESTHIHIFIYNGINASIKISNSSEFEHGRDIRKMKSIVIDKPPRTCQCIDNIATFFPTY